MPEPDVGAAVDWSLAQRRGAIGSTVLDLGADPDKAARAVQLGQATGADPVLINQDLDGFERQHRASIVTNILNSNERLREWIASDPMAAKVAADDWGQLDTVSSKLDKVKWDIGAPPRRVGQEAFGGFAEGYSSAAGASEPKFQEEYEQATPYIRSLLASGRQKMDFLNAIFHGALEAVSRGAAQVAREVGADEGTAKRFGREAAGFAEFKTIDIAGKGIHVGEAEAFAVRLNTAIKKAEPWLSQGKKPPVGVDPLIDRMYAEKAKADAKDIDEILNEAHKSLVRERAPDVFAGLIRRHIGERPMAISFDAVQKLYGDKLPESGDGLLGDIPGFAEKYASAAADRSDIIVPMADYIGRVEAEVHRELKEDLKSDPQGMSLNDAKVEAPPPTEPEAPKTLRQTVKDAAFPNQLAPVLLEEGQPEQSLFGKMAIGLLKKDYDRFVRLIERESAEERAWELRQALEERIKALGKEWKETSARLRPEVAMDVSTRPEWTAHDWFNDGVLRGTQGEKPKIDPKFLTPEQRKALPKKYQEVGGSKPDDFASQAGFNSGDEMVNVMGRFYERKGDLPPGEYLKKVVDQELELRVEAELGKPAATLIAEAQDAVTGITPLERLHEQTVLLGVKAGQGITFTRESMRRGARNVVGERLVGEQSRDGYLAMAGEAGRKMTQAWLKADITEAFRQQQRQYAATLLAKEAGKVEKERAKFEKDAKRFYKREIEGYKNIFGGPYVPYIHQVLAKMGKEIERSPKDLEDAIAQGGFGTLREFARAKEAELREIGIPDTLVDGKPPKQVGAMTVNEFRANYNGLKALIKNGRDESTVYVEGQAHAIEDVVGQMVESIKEHGLKDIDKKKGVTLKKGVKFYYASSLTPESILNRLDRDDPKGPHNQFVVRSLTTAANHEARLQRFYQRALLEAVGEIPDINKMVENSLWVDPVDGTPIPMTKRNVLGILSYWGSPSSRKKLLEGYNVNERAALEWLHERTTKEDWDRMQRIGRIFERLVKEADKMSMELKGSPIEKIEILPFDTKFGRYKGWYNPIKYDPLYATEREVVSGEKILEGEGYYRATTSQGYTKARTEYVSPVELDLDMIPTRINQVIHDLAFRQSVIQVSKIFYNTTWRNAMRRYYGPDFERQFIPYLKDVANYSNRMPDFGEMILEKFRQNLIATMIGFNPNTVMKHGMTAAFNSMTEVGPINWMKAFKSLVQVNEETSRTNWRFAMDTSEELQRRMRNWNDLTVRTPAITLKKMGLRETMITFGATPVAFSDLLSSVPTWLAMYEKAIKAGEDVGTATFMADRAVRRAHGSSAITNLPAIMRGNALARTFTSLYGFFSHMMQKQYEMAWKARDSFVGLRSGDPTAMKRHAPMITWGLVSYIIIPAVVEELVTPYVGHEKDSWGKWAAKTLTHGLAASYIGPKDFVHGMMNAAEPTAGLIGTWFKNGTKFARDLAKGTGAFDRQHAGKTIADTATLVGMMTGLSTAQLGRSTEFMIRWNNGLEHPKSGMEWLQGLRKGTIKERRR